MGAMPVCLRKGHALGPPCGAGAGSGGGPQERWRLWVFTASCILEQFQVHRVTATHRSLCPPSPPRTPVTHSGSAEPSSQLMSQH